MTKPLTLECDVHFQRRRKGSREVVVGAEPAGPTKRGRVPRISRLMALAIRFDALVKNGVVTDYAELARLSSLTLWKDYPGFNRLDATFALSRKMAFRREGFVRTVLKRQEITADDIAKCPLTPKTVARELKEMFREMVGR